MDKETWHTSVHGVAKSPMCVSNAKLLQSDSLRPMDYSISNKPFILQWFQIYIKALKIAQRVPTYPTPSDPFQ